MQWQTYLRRYDRRLLASSEGRRAITRRDPMAFSMLYLRAHLQDPEGAVTLSDVHWEWAGLARQLMSEHGVRGFRHMMAAPRSMGKSTWWFLLIPLWAAAHGHRRFMSAFADSRAQAEEHLATFVRELETNILLREDYPDLCRPRKRATGAGESNRRGMYLADSGFVFVARGIDSKLLGMKVGSARPDMIILDDVEGEESTYSPDKATKRLKTIQDGILPLNDRAAVVLTGTVTMDGSIIHQGVKAANQIGDPAEWITDDQFTCHHFRPIIAEETEGEDGEPVKIERSVWPEKWPIEYLVKIRHTRSFLKNFENMPLSTDGKYWTSEHFQYGQLESSNIRLLSVDPHVKKSELSDFTGLAVVRYSSSADAFDVPMIDQTKLKGKELRARLLRLIEQFEITAVLIETNQGGDLWVEEGGVCHDLGVKVVTVHQNESKIVRAERALGEYEAGKVWHWSRMLDAESQMCAFPAVAHDDMVDALSSAIIEIRKRRGVRQTPAKAQQGTWVR